MKRIFTSFLTMVVCFVAFAVQAASPSYAGTPASFSADLYAAEPNADDHIVTYEVSKGGSLVLEDFGTDRVLASGDKVAHEAFVAATIKIDGGYKLVSFKVNDLERLYECNINPHDAFMALTVTEDTHIIVRFERDASAVMEYPVTVETPVITDGTLKVMNGNKEVKGKGVMIEEGTVLTLSNTPVYGKVFEAYLVNGVETQENTVEVNGPLVIGAKFAKKEIPAGNYQVHISSNEGGSVVVAAHVDGLLVDVADGDEVPNGSTLTITVIPNDGMTFKSVLNGEDNSSAYTKNEGIPGFVPTSYELNYPNETENVNLKVQFYDPAGPQPEVKPTITYSVTPAEGGSVTVYNSGKEVASGSEVEPGTATCYVSIKVKEGYSLKSVLVNGVESKDKFSEVMPGMYGGFNLPAITEDVDIKVEFNAPAAANPVITYSATPAEGGSVTVYNSGQEVASGSEVAKGTATCYVSIKVKEGYTLKSVLVNGVESKDKFSEVMPGMFGGFNLPAINEDVDIKVEFGTPSAGNPVITTSVTPAEGGSVTVYHNGQEIESGSEVAMGTTGCYVSIRVNKGYSLKSVLVNGVESKDQFNEVMEGLFGGYNLPAINENIDIKVEFNAPAASDPVITYSVTPAEGGSVTVYNSGQVVESGSSVAEGTSTCYVTIRVNEGYSLKSVLVNGIESKDQFSEVMDGVFGGYNLPAINENVNIVVELNAPAVSGPVITYSATPAEGGNVTVYNNGQVIKSGSSVEEGTVGCYVTINVTKGYEIKSVLVNGVESKDSFFEVMDGVFGGYNLPAITESVNIVVEFTKPSVDQPTVTYTVSPANGGTVVLKLDGNEIENGSRVEVGSYVIVYAYPEEGRTVESFKVNGEEKVASLWRNSYGVDIMGNTTIDVVFSGAGEVEGCTVNYSFNAEGGNVAATYRVPSTAEKGDLSNGATVPVGAKVSFFMYPETDYTVSSIDVDGVPARFNQAFDGDYYVAQVTVAEAGEMNVVITFSNVTGIGSVTLEGAAYNGAAHTLNVPEGAYAVVYSADGRQVLAAEGGQTVSTAALATGTYMARIASGSAVKVIKFIKK